jgi:hypothetical protein
MSDTLLNILVLLAECCYFLYFTVLCALPFVVTWCTIRWYRRRVDERTQRERTQHESDPETADRFWAIIDAERWDRKIHTLHRPARRRGHHPRPNSAGRLPR